MILWYTNYAFVARKDFTRIIALLLADAGIHELAHSCLWQSSLNNVISKNIQEGEMLIKTQPTSPLQMFYEFIVQSKEARPISIALKAMGLVQACVVKTAGSTGS